MNGLNFTREDIEETFDEKTINRGYDYYTSQKVMKFDIYINKDKDVEIFSKVLGTELYEQHLAIYTMNNKIHIDGDCSCPVGYNCKHIVAVLFQALYKEEHQVQVENNESEIVQEIDKSQLWLDEFIELNSQNEERVIEDRDEELIFKLFEEKKDDLEFYKSKRLKNGTMSKGAKVSKENMFHYYGYDWKYTFLTDKDRAMIALIKSLSDEQDRTKFRGEYAVVVLRELIKTQRCFFQKSTKPLSWVDRTKILSFSWVENEESNKLVSNLHDNEFIIPLTSPALCIDTDKNIIFEAQTSYNAEVLEYMFNAPEVSNSNINKVTQTILNELPNVEFPIPNRFEMKRIEVAPQPYLYLYSQKEGDNNIHLMKMSFLYEDYKIASNNQQDTTLITRNNESIKINRDRLKEQVYRDIIEEAGFTFESHPKILSYLSIANPDMQTAIERWRSFITDKIPELTEAGWSIEIDKNFNYTFEYVDNVTVESSQSTETNSWFELSFSVEIGGKSVALMPIVASLIHDYDHVEDLPQKLNLELEEGRFLHIESKDIKPILGTIFELYDKKKGDTLIIKPFDAHLLDIDEESSIIWKGVRELKALSQKLKDFQGIESIPPSENLQVKLRDYQQFGIDWLNFLYEFKFGGILADDMGLGKTVQTLAFLQSLKERVGLKKPSLIVMPTSLIGNWKSEIIKFTPNLTYLELYGLDRAEKFDEIKHYDIILTTYALAQRDVEKYTQIDFLYIILDEAQKIKNPRTKMSLAIKSFHSDYKLALSGTPIENHLGELWSIFDFLMGGFLDSLKSFKSYYQNPIEQERDISRRDVLNKKIAPFILRRTKDEVVKELPPKTEIIKKAKFDQKQANLYENIRVTMEQKVRDAIKGKGLSRSHITILDALLKLRQVCCHPQLLKLESASAVQESAKLEMFLELIDDLNLEGRKVLVFSQFTSMLAIIEEHIKERNISYSKLIGSTRKREEAIEKFTKGNANIFLISLKAGGVGLNLVEADTVIHYDPWWNPAVENQATDRAYRIGQNKAVFVYKLIVENSIEEQIVKLQERKKALQSSIYEGDETINDKFEGEELLELLKI